MHRPSPYPLRLPNRCATLAPEMGCFWHCGGKVLLLAAAFLATKGFSQSNELVELTVKFGELYGQGRFPEARETAAELLERLEKTRGANDLDVAANLNNVASLTYVEGDLNAAEPLYQRALEIYEALLGSHHPNVASVLYNLAGLYVQQGRYDRAEALYERALDIGEASFEPNPETLNNLAFLFLKQDRYEKAERLFKRALAIWEEAIGSESAQAAVGLSNLALLEAKRGSFTEAETFYARALSVEEAFFGNEHPEVATTLNNLAIVYRVQGKQVEAFALHNRALAILEGTVGLGDPLTLETVRYLGALLPGVSRQNIPIEEAYSIYEIIVVRGRNEAEDLFERIQRGEKFAVLAAKHSIDGSASIGGYVRASLSDFRAEVRQKLRPLSDGEMSLPFPLNGSWAIVKKVYEPSFALE